MSALLTQIPSAKLVANHRPWPRAIVGADGWRLAGERLAQGLWTLAGLWGDEGRVHMAVQDEPANECSVLSLDCTDGHFPSVAAHHPPALRLERTAQDLYGLVADGLPDTRPWLDHGRWKEPRTAETYPFLPVEGESLTEIAVGPVHAGIIEPGFFRFTTNGEVVVRLEERLGYTHKGIERLMAGAEIKRGLKLAGRICGDSTVGYSYAFVRAAEAALEIDVPARGVWLRALMAELERMANHFGDFGAICNDAAFAIMHAQCGVVRERILRAAYTCFGHRMMRDCIAVGGVISDLTAEGGSALRALADEIAKRLPRLVELYDRTASLQDRTVGTGILRTELVRQIGCGGYVGRASGRAFDARRAAVYPPYDRLQFDVPVLSEGDVNARIWIRIREIEQSLLLLRQILDGLPEGALRADAAAAANASGEGVALIEGFRGDILVWLRFGADGKIEHCHLRDPSWFQWPLLEAAIDGNIVADFPLCNKSFNCAYSGHDL